jgi:2,4-dienoyl-CoA reductase-like NADH-dependent reductase (Old Yellow Enzyme family)
MKTLFSSIKIREKTFENRIFVSPMCQYSSENGLVGDWHLVHLGSRAVGGAALVMVEATAVSPEGPNFAPGQRHLVRRTQRGL